MNGGAETQLKGSSMPHMLNQHLSSAPLTSRHVPGNALKSDTPAATCTARATTPRPNPLLPTLYCGIVP